MTVTDPFGRVMASKDTAPSDTSTPAMMAVMVPIYSISTFYAHYGDCFVWSMFALFALGLVLWRVRRS